MAMVVDNKFEFGQVVYLKTDCDQIPRLLTGIDLRPNMIIYQLSCGTISSNHYDFEMSAEKSLVELSNE